MTLAGSLSATVGDGAVEFRYEVANEGSAAVDLQFSDGQTHEIVVFEDGDPVWTFSDGQMFMQMLQSESVEPGDSLVYDETWENASSGEYVARAWLTANDAEAEAETSFSV